MTGRWSLCVSDSDGRGIIVTIASCCVRRVCMCDIVAEAVMAQRLSEAAAAINAEQLATQLFTRAKTFFQDLKAKIV